MFVREVKYYCMSTKQLNKEVMKLRLKLESEQSFEKKKKYLNALADVIKTLIRKYRNDEVFMAYVTKELNKLRDQIKEAL